MSEALILVADGARARFIAVDSGSARGGLRLAERQDLVEPERALPGKEIFRNLKSGRKQSPGGGPAHGMDDHRGGHRREVEVRFAQRIAKAAAEHLRRESCDWLIAVAEPRLLGLLRPRLDVALPASVRRVDLGEDLSRQDVPHIHRVLARRGILPETVKSRAGYRPRGQLAPPPVAERLSPLSKVPKRRKRP